MQRSKAFHKALKQSKDSFPNLDDEDFQYSFSSQSQRKKPTGSSVPRHELSSQGAEHGLPTDYSKKNELEDPMELMEMANTSSAKRLRTKAGHASQSQRTTRVAQKRGYSQNTNGDSDGAADYGDIADGTPSKLADILEENKRLRELVDLLQKRSEAAEKSFEDLAKLRHSEAELLHEEYKATAEQRFKAADDMIQTLQQVKQENEAEIRNLKQALLQEEIKPSEIQRNPEQDREIEALTKTVEELNMTVSQLQRERDAAVRAKSISNEPQDEAHRKLKQIKDMYEDLTGLVITDIKQVSEENVYNCIQTGRNGTIQFKLFQSVDGVQDIRYQPVLDERRDADLIASLPDYFVTDIEFGKDKATLFHWRLVTFLQSKNKNK